MSDGLFGWSILSGKKEYAPSWEIQYSPTEGARVYAPQIGYSPQYSYGYQGATYIIGSPEAVSKKEMDITQKSEQPLAYEWTAPVTGATPSMTTGTNLGNLLIILAVIGVVGAVGVSLIGKKKKK
jgi:hypothetical protein